MVLVEEVLGVGVVGHALLVRLLIFLVIPVPVDSLLAPNLASLLIIFTAVAALAILFTLFDLVVFTILLIILFLLLLRGFLLGIAGFLLIFLVVVLLLLVVGALSFRVLPGDLVGQELAEFFDGGVLGAEFGELLLIPKRLPIILLLQAHQELHLQGLDRVHVAAGHGACAGAVHFMINYYKKEQNRTDFIGMVVAIIG